MSPPIPFIDVEAGSDVEYMAADSTRAGWSQPGPGESHGCLCATAPVGKAALVRDSCGDDATWEVGNGGD